MTTSHNSDVLPTSTDQTLDSESTSYASQNGSDPSDSHLQERMNLLVNRTISLIIALIVCYVAVSFTWGYLEPGASSFWREVKTRVEQRRSSTELDPLFWVELIDQAELFEPDAISGYPRDSVKRIYSGIGGWYTWDNGKRIDLDSDDALSQFSIKPKAFLIHEFDRPRLNNLSDELPVSLPIFIQMKSGQVGELKIRGRRAMNLMIDKLTFSASLVSDLWNALWFVQRPLTKTELQVLSITKEWGQRLQPENPLNPYQPREVGLLWLIPSMKDFGAQTVVIAGDIDGDTMYFHDKGGSDEQSISLSDLRAVTNDGIILILVDTPLEHVAAAQKNLSEFVQHNPTMLELNQRYIPEPLLVEDVYIETYANRGYTYIAEWYHPAKTQTQKVIEQQAGVEGLQVYMNFPDRVDELDGRIIKDVYQPIQHFVLLSIFLGVLCRNTSWKAWNGFWRNKKRPGAHQSYFSFGFFWLLHKMFYIAVFLPIFGSLIFFCSILTTLLEYLHWFLIKPLVWVVKKIGDGSTKAEP